MSKPMDKTFEQQNFFGRGPENSGFAQYFSGTSYLNPLTKPGESAVFLANVKHWHGAQKDSWFSHIAVEVPGEDTAAEWCEPVDDATYQAL